MTDRPISRVRNQLYRVTGYEVKQSGRGWSARCPAHDDHRPSLSINEGDDGQALICCHKGCTVDAICAALGIGKVELFPKRGGGYTRGIPKRPTRPTTYLTARDAIADLEHRHGKRSALWTYRDSEGKPVGVIVRWDTATGKDIRPVSRKSGGWIIGGMPEPRPLYRLPDLVQARRVYITEGEKAAEALWTIRLVATTSAHGSKSPHKTDWTPLAGKECVILPDNDDAGRKYAEAVATILTLTPASVVKVVELSGLPPGGDMVDFLEARRAVQ